MKFKDFVMFIVGILVALLIWVLLINKMTPPVEKHDNDNTISEIKHRNDSIKIIVNNLDSIKRAKVVEVSTLNNDSTVKLFYKLVSE